MISACEVHRRQRGQKVIRGHHTLWNAAVTPLAVVPQGIPGSWRADHPAVTPAARAASTAQHVNRVSRNAKEAGPKLVLSGAFDELQDSCVNSHFNTDTRECH